MMTRPGKRQTQTGFTYIEAMLGALLLSVCLAPALHAINDSIARRVSLQNSERDMHCLLRTKERVFAIPFSELLGAAKSTHAGGKFSNPTSYSNVPTAACPVKQDVYILRYDATLAEPFTTTRNDMVYVRVEQANGLSVATLSIQE